MKTLLSILAIVALFILPGCTSFFNDYEQYSTAMKAHSEYESTRISAQAQAIAATVAAAQSEDKTVNTLTAVIGMMQIERLQPTSLDMERPTTGFDVLNSAVGVAPSMFGVYGMWKLGEAGIKAAGNTTFGDNTNLTDSLNSPEVHTTGYSTSTYTGTAEPTVVTTTAAEE